MGLIERVLVVVALGAAGCGPEPSPAASQDPPQVLRGSTANPCKLGTLTVCVGAFTGPMCSIPCDVDGGGGDTTTGEMLGTTGGAPEDCGYRVYCHDDESLYGLAVFNAHLFEFSPSDTPAQITGAFESFVADHEPEIGLALGLSTADLTFAPADNFVVDQGQLRLYRFVQTYPLRSSIVVPVADASALLTLEADSIGAVTLKGTVVDTRISYANHAAQATPALAESSIIEHTSAQTGLDEADIVVDGLHLVAVPSLQRVAWSGRPRVGPVALAHVLVDADPAEGTLLDLLRYDERTVDGLFDTQQVSVRTQDLSEPDPWEEPAPESVEATRADGEPLLGSIFDGNNEVQLGTTEIVVLDLLGNDLAIMTENDFERYTDAVGEFEVAQPGDQFNPQRLYHLAQSGYAIVERVALGKWDSAVQHVDAGATSDFDPGTYRPRMVVAYNHEPHGAVGRASLFLPPIGNPMVPTDPENWFPEAYLRPDPSNHQLQPEVVGTLQIPSSFIVTEAMLHELGHNFDYFLGPGWPRDGSPPDCPSCADGCDEDTTDESYPLTETIAQMFAMWQLVRLFPDLPYETCDLMTHFAQGTNNNAPLVHSPGCMDETDEIGLLIRDDDPACTDISVCDKPSSEGGHGGIKRCDHNAGYNTFSVLQVWWNTLHGLYCEPTYPFACTSVAVTWPPGCDQMGSHVDCITQDEAAGLAFLYALRTDPMTYVDFFDSMARFVSCNYGTAAYDDFNQALCEHEIRSCTEPPPSDCDVCGNGIREGGEECDGNDLSVDVLGYVPGCTDLGYMGGVLGCTQQCTYETSQCVAPGTTSSSEGTSSDEGGGEEDTSDTETSGGGADGGVGDGCGCVASGARHQTALWVFGLLLVGVVRRRRDAGWSRERVAAIVVLVSTSACGDDDATANDATGSSSSTSGATNDTATPVPGWPDNWLGEYHVEKDVRLGFSYDGPILFLPENVTLERDRAWVQVYDCTGTDTAERSYRVAFEPNSVRLLPENDGEELYWVDGTTRLEQLALRPGETCDQLEFLHDYGDSTDGDSDGESVAVLPLVRGRLCVIDPCDLADPNEDPTFILDYCPNTVRECAMPAMDSN